MEQKGKVESEWKYLYVKGRNSKKVLVTKNILSMCFGSCAVPHDTEL